MEFFEIDEMADKAQSDGLVSLVTIILIWNELLGKFVAKMMHNISTDPNYYTDETYSDMMSLVYAGEEFDKKMGRALLLFRNYTLDKYLETKRILKVDFYDILFAISESKSYIIEMDHYAANLGISNNALVSFKVSKAVDQMIEALLK